MSTSTLPTHAVRYRRSFYGKQADQVGIAYVGTLSECREYIREDDACIYYTSHNEVGRCHLHTVRTASLRQHALLEARQLFEEGYS